MSSVKRWWTALITRSIYLFLVMVTLSLMFSGSIFGFKIATAGWLIGTALFAVIPAIMEVIAYFVLRMKK